MSQTNTKESKLKATAKKKPRQTVEEKPKPGRGRKPGDKGRLEAHKGAKEKRAARGLRAFQMRVDGKPLRAIAKELRCAVSTVHEDIETVVKELREQSVDLAAHERAVAVQQLDTAISYIMPHIRGSVDIRTVTPTAKGVKVITVEEWEARNKSISSLTKLIDRKSKLLGLDAPLKIEAPEPP